MMRILQRLSSRVRLSLALAAAALPFVTVLVFANLWVYGPMKVDLQVISDEVQARFEEVGRLQLLLAQCAMPPNDFLIHGASDERIRFELMAGRIESIFGNLLRTVSATHEAEQKRLGDMVRRWAVARKMGDSLLTWPAESRLTSGAEFMERFDRELDQLTEDAEALLAHVRVELEDARDLSIRRRHDLNRFVGLATAMAGILTLLLMTLLGRAVSEPVAARSTAVPPPILPPSPVLATEPAVPDFSDEPPPASVEAVAPMAGSGQEPAVDPLTRLWSRGSLQRQLAIETERAMVLETPSSIAIIEIDGFDQLAERYGEESLSSVVLTVSERLRHIIRSTDFPSRSNAGEFAVLMPATDIRQAVALSERLCQEVAEVPVSIGRRTASITVSIGVAGDSVGRAGQVGASTLLGRADQAMHRARRAGGNRVERSGGR
ncbi:MAG: GGDEF domain-containing protein [Rhodocyclaceae bacterium]|nr:GGDEF domain-containing protein [Rhodocyclaceae bacterium]